MSDTTYVVMHDWQTEGWKIVGSYDNPLDAVLAREAELRDMGGGVVTVFIEPGLCDLYRDAGYEQSRRLKEAETKATTR